MQTAMMPAHPITDLRHYATPAGLALAPTCMCRTFRHPARSPPPVILRAAKRRRRIQTSVAVNAATDAQHDERVCAYDGWGYLVNLNHVA